MQEILDAILNDASGPELQAIPLPETFRAMAPYAGRLDAETLEKIAERAEARGHPNLAALIRTPAGDPR